MDILQKAFTHFKQGQFRLKEKVLYSAWQEMRIGQNVSVAMHRRFRVL
jgi:hypothetical protein